MEDGGGLEVLDLGRCAYLEAHARMRSLVEERAQGRGRDTLILAEFEPVVTVGRGARAESYQGLPLPVLEVERGGRATYHGPGQIVAYPVVRLEEGRRDLRAFLHLLEEALIRCVADFGLEGGRDPRNTGCWVGGRKVASIGIAVRRWVTWHGLALNVETDLEAFGGFDPCGLEPELLTSMERELGQSPGMEAVRRSLVRHLQEVLCPPATP